MSDDIVDRLREVAAAAPKLVPEAADGADEIVRLRAEVERLTAEWRVRHARRWQWVRMHITQRNDDFYSRIRKARKEGQ